MAPPSTDTIGYSSNERQAKTTSVPGSDVALANCPHSDTDPAPTATWFASTPSLTASRSHNSTEAVSG